MHSLHILVNSWDSNGTLKLAIIVVGIISIIFSIFVTFAYFKQVQEHPSILIVMTCICEGIYLYHELLNLSQQTMFFSDDYDIIVLYKTFTFGLYTIHQFQSNGSFSSKLHHMPTQLFLLCLLRVWRLDV